MHLVPDRVHGSAGHVHRHQTLGGTKVIEERLHTLLMHLVATLWEGGGGGGGVGDFIYSVLFFCFFVECVCVCV